MGIKVRMKLLKINGGIFIPYLRLRKSSSKSCTHAKLYYSYFPDYFSKQSESLGQILFLAHLFNAVPGARAMLAYFYSCGSVSKNKHLQLELISKFTISKLQSANTHGLNTNALTD